MHCQAANDRPLALTDFIEMICLTERIHITLSNGSVVTIVENQPEALAFYFVAYYRLYKP